MACSAAKLRAGDNCGQQDSDGRPANPLPPAAAWMLLCVGDCASCCSAQSGKASRRPGRRCPVLLQLRCTGEACSGGRVCSLHRSSVAVLLERLGYRRERSRAALAGEAASVAAHQKEVAGQGPWRVGRLR